MNQGEPSGRAEEPGGARRIALDLASRIEEILATAENTAVAIEREAEAAAERYLAERRREADREAERKVADAERDAAELAAAVAGIVADLRRQAQDVIERSTALEAAVNEVLGRLRGTGDASPVAAVVPVAPEAAPPASDRPRSRAPEEALLRAAQLAIGGTEREEIARVLSEEFDLDAPGSVVDDILGR